MAGWRIRTMLLVVAALGTAAVARADSPSPSAVCPGAAADASVADSGATAIDARSIRLSDGRVLRLAGIEPFDLLLPDAGRAEAELQSRLGEIVGPGTLRFQLLAETPDRYGRLPALAWAADELIQEVVVRAGLAIAYANGDPLPCFDRLLAAEESARRAHRGFWKDQSLPGAFPAALASRVGHFAIFEGRVLSVGNRPPRSYLNFGYRWRKDVTVEVAAADREAFGGEPGLAAMAGHRVRVRGFLEEHSGPTLVVNSPMQLEVLDPAKEGSGQAP